MASSTQQAPLITTGSNMMGGSAQMGLTDQSAGSSTLNRYTTDYYSGNQVSLWMGDLWLDDITMVMYNMTQAKHTFYGYKSQKYNTLAAGIQIVQGVFAMNYTHTNALNMAVAFYLQKKQSTSSTSSAAKVTAQQVQQFISDAQNNPAMYINLNLPLNAPAGSPATNPLSTGYNSTINSLNFNDMSNLLSDFFWNQSSKTVDVIVADELPDFDITISFGNYPNERLYGGPDENISSHTVKVLNNVSITGHSIQADTNGDVVQEVYAFTARGITTPLTRNAMPFGTPANTTKTTGNAVNPATASLGGTVAGNTVLGSNL